MRIGTGLFPVAVPAARTARGRPAAGRDPRRRCVSRRTGSPRSRARPRAGTRCRADRAAPRTRGVGRAKYSASSCESLSTQRQPGHALGVREGGAQPAREAGTARARQPDARDAGLRSPRDAELPIGVSTTAVASFTPIAVEPSTNCARSAVYFVVEKTRAGGQLALPPSLYVQPLDRESRTSFASRGGASCDPSSCGRSPRDVSPSSRAPSSCAPCFVAGEPRVARSSCGDRLRLAAPSSCGRRRPSCR